MHKTPTFLTIHSHYLKRRLKSSPPSTNEHTLPPQYLLVSAPWACQYLLYLTLGALFKLRNAHEKSSQSATSAALIALEI